MEPCRDFQCLIDRLRGRSRSSTSTTVGFTFSTTETNRSPASGNSNGFFPVTASFRILLPILLVLGVFVLIAIGFIVHRLVIRVLRKRWASRSNAVQATSHRSTRGNSQTRREGRVTTVSGYVDSPPTYRQVLATIENGESPPPYYQVANGVVNIGFVEENEQPRGRNNQSNDANLTNQESQTRNASTQNTSSPQVAMATLPPVETPRLRIDDIIDSISVPSNGMTSIKRDNKVKKGHRVLRASVSLPLNEPAGVQLTSFARSTAPKTTVTNGTDEQTIARPSLESAVQATPV